MRRFINWFLVAAITLLPSCSLMGGGTTTFDVCSAASAAGSEEAAAEAAAVVVVQLHTTSPTIMTDAKYAQAKMAYSALSTANGLILSALISINDASGNTSAVTPQQYAQLLAQAAIAAAQFYAIYSAATNQAAPPAKHELSLGATAACTITDAQLTQQLTMTAWPGN